MSRPIGTRLGVYLATLEEGWSIGFQRDGRDLIMQIAHVDGRRAREAIAKHDLDCAMEQLGGADQLIADRLQGMFWRTTR